MGSTARCSHSEFPQWQPLQGDSIIRGMSHPASTVLLATASLLLGGCAVGPRYHRPEAPPHAGFTVQPLPGITSEAPVHGGASQRLIVGDDMPFEWWEQFQSPALNALIAKAFAANPSVTAAQSALRQAQELVRAQRGFFFPSIGGGISGRAPQSLRKYQQ